MQATSDLQQAVMQPATSERNTTICYMIIVQLPDIIFAILLAFWTSLKWCSLPIFEGSTHLLVPDFLHICQSCDWHLL